MRDVADDRLRAVGARLGVGIGDVDPAGDVDLAGRGIAAAFLGGLGELALVERGLRGQGLDAGQRRKHQAEAVAAAIADRAVGAAGHVERGMRHLQGLRQHLVGRRDGAVEVLALVIVAMAMEGLEHQPDGLLDHVAPALEVLAQPLEFVGPVARADAQHDAAVGQDIDEVRILDDADRVVERQRDHA